MKTLVRFGPHDHGRLVTDEELHGAEYQEGYRYEIIDGRLYVSPIANLPHDYFKEMLKTAFSDYARQNPSVINHIAGPVRVFVHSRPATTVPEPDLALYADFPHQLPPSQMRWQDVSPILVVEILSEDTSNKDLVRNVELYREVPSIQEYWILDTLEDHDYPTLFVHRRRGRNWRKQPIRVEPGMTYTTPVLPGFSFTLNAPPK